MSTTAPTAPTEAPDVDTAEPEPVVVVPPVRWGAARSSLTGPPRPRRHHRQDHTALPGRLYSIGIGRTHTRTRVIVLAHDRHIHITNAATGQLIRELILDPTKRYQPIPRPTTSH